MAGRFAPPKALVRKRRAAGHALPSREKESRGTRRRTGQLFVAIGSTQRNPGFVEYLIFCIRVTVVAFRSEALTLLQVPADLPDPAHGSQTNL